MTSKDDQPTSIQHPELAPTQVWHWLLLPLTLLDCLVQEEGPTELARHSVSSSEDKSSSQESRHDPEVTIAYESQVWTALCMALADEMCVVFHSVGYYLSLSYPASGW